jgi:hypothetical protein
MRRMKIAYVLLGLAAASLGYACSKDDSKPSNTTTTNGGSCPECDTTPGAIPAATCGYLACTPNAACGDRSATTTCSIDESKCGSKATCLPMADNANKQVLDFRIRRLNVIAPETLAQSFVQSVVVTKNIDLKDACGDQGNGAFNWLIRLDKSNNTFLTGGAPPADDPFGQGYCFFRGRTGDKHDGLLVNPTEGTFKTEGETLTAGPVEKLNIPIFVNGDPNNVVVLPISNGTIKNITVSPDGNCIGGLNAAALNDKCGDDPTICSKWLAGGSLGGYITLEEADGVYVADLSESLCVLLTKSAKGPDTKCQRENGKIKFAGDYCSTTKSAGGCADSFWMSATFAASAAKIHDGKTVAACSGVVADAGAPDSATEDSGAKDAAAE